MDEKTVHQVDGLSTALQQLPNSAPDLAHARKSSTCCLLQLTVNIVAVSTACIGAIAVQESPLTAVQMLWLNLIMDSLASLALATEQPTDAMLDLPPYSSRQSLLTPTV